MLTRNGLRAEYVTACSSAVMAAANSPRSARTPTERPVAAGKCGLELDGTLRGLERLVRRTGKREREACQRGDQGGQRLEPLRLPGELERVRAAPQRRQQHREPHVRLRPPWTQLDGPPELPFRALQIPSEIPFVQAHRVMGLAQAVVEGERPLRRVTDPSLDRRG